MTMTETTLRKLSTDEVAIYREQGYVIVPDIFPLEELAEIGPRDRSTSGKAKKNGAQQGMDHAVGIALRSDPPICTG